MATNTKRLLKRAGWTVAVIFVLMNVIAYFHAYKFTHFNPDSTLVRKNPKDLTTAEKARILFTGIDNPRPINTQKPTQPYTTIKLKSNVALECWHIKAKDAKGTVVLFHGYAGDKSQMLDKSDAFLKMGYNTLLVDFMGSGGSGGNSTSIGYHEAEEVKTCFEYLKHQGENNIYLFGTSMGAVAILKTISDYLISPEGIIIECPFGTMYQTVCARFNAMHVPTFPMAGLLMFWGGVQNDFWAFDHNPAEYAKNVNCPALLLYGEKDERVSRAEIDAILKNLNGNKELKTYPNAGHENYLIQYKKEWVKDVGTFLNTY